MQFLKSFAAAATLLTLSANAAHIGKRQSQTCIEGEKYVGVGYNGLQPALRELDIWSEKTCVAAATCDPKTAFVAQCQNSAVANATDIAHLDYNVYAAISYIDLIYGALSDIGSSSYPASGDEVVSQWWTPLTTWTATGDSVPYTNFDDWLHYAAVYD
ncbi:uncharacterized protein STEHIDRAFT_160922 [Stereum hirsutum FP-91666 SS1]|uniref:uncharacterized protein n=1 Tax=Stereum hirsutum (strain FP-91666) TaxID=721885 RepID=UPI00044491FB|nr:uncharacterized protein STEHIDRAFT_160922 [Stereum hirsutum FP-91666 SS1]EIM82374.1 hypothetical protein STEHIDRAFT_160922 [Stereum hirsutum FP-91666 SS1]